MLRLTPTLPAALGMALLYGCAAAAGSPVTTNEVEPDCSFRAATSCWTLAGRFPPSRPRAADPEPSEMLEQPATLAASRPDTSKGSEQ